MYKLDVYLAFYEVEKVNVVSIIDLKITKVFKFIGSTTGQFHNSNWIHSNSLEPGRDVLHTSGLGQARESKN